MTTTPAMPLRAIDRIFERLVLTYGDAFMRPWATFLTTRDGRTPEEKMAAIKTQWADELGGFATRMDCIGWALENLPERAPNVVQFKQLCRQAPVTAQDNALLPAPAAASPERVRAELERLGWTPAGQRPADSQPVDRLAWAKRIVRKRARGAQVALATHRIACEALAMHGLDPSAIAQEEADALA